MDESKLFNVVLVGGIKEGFDKNAVISSLAALFKLPVEKAGALLNGKSQVVKGSVDTATAAKYKVAIERTGACCRLEAIPQEQPLEFDFTNESLGSKNSLPPATKPPTPMDRKVEPPPKIPNQIHPVANPALWNPSALANWSILFTPLFGSYYVSENYKAMGKEKKAKGAMVWLYIGIAIMISIFFVELFNLSSYFRKIIPAYFVYLISWYFLSARKQGQSILSTYGKDYERQPWMKVLAIGGAAMVAWQLLLRLF